MITQEQNNFINLIGELANKDMKANGILASLTVAQAILESGWGKKFSRNSRKSFVWN